MPLHVQSGRCSVLSRRPTGVVFGGVLVRRRSSLHQERQPKEAQRHQRKRQRGKVTEGKKEGRKEEGREQRAARSAAAQASTRHKRGTLERRRRWQLRRQTKRRRASDQQREPARSRERPRLPRVSSGYLPATSTAPARIPGSERSRAGTLRKGGRAAQPAAPVALETPCDACRPVDLGADPARARTGRATPLASSTPSRACGGACAGSASSRMS